MTTPRIGFFMPIYNQDPDLLFTAVSTMIDQTLFERGELRLLFILDGPNEATRSALYNALDGLRLKIKHPANVAVYDRKHNIGLAATQVEGFRLMDTLWTGWVSSDNWHAPHMAERLLEVADSAPNDPVFVSSFYEILNPDGKEPEWRPTHRAAHLHLFSKGADAGVLDLLRVGGAMMAGIVRRDVLDHILPRPALDGAEDLDFTTRIALAYPGRLFLHPEPLMRWTYCTEHSVSRTWKPKIIRAITRVWTENVLPRIGEPQFAGLRFHFVRPHELERIVALSNLTPFNLGSSDVMALLVPRPDYEKWCRTFADFPLFLQMLLPEGP